MVTVQLGYHKTKRKKAQGNSLVRLPQNQKKTKPKVTVWLGYQSNKQKKDTNKQKKNKKNKQKKNKKNKQKKKQNTFGTLDQQCAKYSKPRR